MKVDVVFPKYPEYKNSEIIWLEDVPKHWQIKKLKHCASVRLSNVDKHTVEGEQGVILCNYLDVYRNRSITASIDFMRATATYGQIKRLRLIPDDVLITKDSESRNDIGVPSIVREVVDHLVCGYHLALLRPSGVNGNFLQYYLRGSYSRACFEVEAQGLTRYALGKDEISSQIVMLPPPEEQILVAEFLDRETAKIDTLIGKQERLIALLTEKRQAVISHAVTKGLDPDAPMKDSNLKWIGLIPRHWVIGRVKNSVEGITSGSRGWAEFYSDEGAIFIRITNLTRDGVDLDMSDTQFVQPPKGLESERSNAKVGDIVVSITADLGSVAVVSDLRHKSYVSQHVALMRPLENVHSRWLAYAIRSRPCQEQFAEAAYGGTKIQLALSDVVNLWICKPPQAEQDAIATFLDTQISKIDLLIARARRSIELMKERRAALISAAVTGKIDVRQAA